MISLMQDPVATSMLSKLKLFDIDFIIEPLSPFIGKNIERSGAMFNVYY